MGSENRRRSGHVQSARKVALVVDNPKRDLRGLVLLAREFAQKGCITYLVPMYQQGYDIPLIEPDLVIVNYARQTNKALLETYKELGYRVAVLDTEGGVLSETGLDSPKNWATSLKNTGLSKLIDDYCFWGSVVQEAFAEDSGMPVDSLKTTGCPRYDLCSPKWKGLLEYDRDDFILVNTNFSAINPRFTHSEKEEVKIFESMGWRRDYIELLLIELKAVFPKYLDVIEKIAIKRPEKTVQIRPHPFEDETVYRNRFAGFDNVIVDGRGDILNAIAHSDCVVHLNCGSAVDSVLTGKIPVSMEFLNTDIMRAHAPLPSSVSLRPDTLDKLIQMLGKDAGIGNYDNIKAIEEIELWYGPRDGAAAERVVEFLMPRLSLHESKPRRSLHLAMNAGRRKPSVLQRVKGMLAIVLGSKLSSDLLDRIQKGREGKKFELLSVRDSFFKVSKLTGEAAPEITHASNPLSGAALSSIKICLK